jgi:integrase
MPPPSGQIPPPWRGGRTRLNRFVWRPAVEQAGLDGLRVHGLRHTAATLAAAAGATTKELMERMGHTSPAVALRYQHVMADRQAAVASALDDLARLAAVPGATRGAPKGTHRARRRR